MPRKKTEEPKIAEEKKTVPVKEAAFYQAIGRRKESTARVRLYTVTSDDGVKVGEMLIKRGDVVINGKPVENYFHSEIYKKIYLEPFRTTNTLGRFATSIKVTGGGTTGQLGAVVHGISRALIYVDPEKIKPILRKRGFLTRDSRKKERRKAGYAGKARARKQSPKR